MKGYLATHFFNEAGFEWSKKVAEAVREVGVDLYVPQENGEINDKQNLSKFITCVDIANADNEYLREANILIACLDGVEIDSGVSAEIGYFSGLIEVESKQMALPKERVIIGLYTDIRQNGSGNNRFYINLYTKGLVMKNGILVKSVEELKTVLKQIVKGGSLW